MMKQRKPRQLQRSPPTGFIWSARRVRRRRIADRDWGAKSTLAEPELDRGKRFALWSFLHMFGSAPDLDVAFESEEDREAARNFMDLLAASEGDGVS